MIKRELEEMEPWPKEAYEGGKWNQHLKKRFVHEKIFENVSDNRDFILSLPPEVTYNLAQLWTSYHKATNAQKDEYLAEFGASWCDYLYGLCSSLDRNGKEKFYENVYKPWEVLILAYHIKLASERLTKRSKPYAGSKKS